MSLRCAETSLLSSVKLLCFCLFSYTFRLRSSFINIFFHGSPPGATFPPPPRPWPPLRRMIGPAFPRRSGHSSFPPGHPVGVPRSPPLAYPQAKPEPRCLVNIILGHFPTGRKWFYNSHRLFPTRRKWAERLASDGDKSSRWQGTPDTSMVRLFLVNLTAAFQLPSAPSSARDV